MKAGKKTTKCFFQLEKKPNNMAMLNGGTRNPANVSMYIYHGPLG